MKTYQYRILYRAGGDLTTYVRTLDAKSLRSAKEHAKALADEYGGRLVDVFEVEVESSINGYGGVTI